MTHSETPKRQGVYFAPEDYVGFWPRLVILVVDTAVVLAWSFLVTFAYNLLLLQLNVPLVYLIFVIGGVWDVSTFDGGYGFQ